VHAVEIVAENANREGLKPQALPFPTLFSYCP